MKQLIPRRTRRFALLVLLLGAVTATRADIDSLSDPGCLDRYRERLLGAPVTENDTELLIGAEVLGMDLLRDRQAMALREFVERRLWLRALNEPAPRPATVRAAISTQWPEYLSELRKRGVRQVLTLQVLAAWTDQDSPPSFETPADNDSAVSKPPDAASPLGTVSARLRLTNAGRVSITALNLNFFNPVVASQYSIAECRWRDYEPLAPGEVRELVCRFNEERKRFATLRHAIEEPVVPADLPYSATVDQVSFADGAYRVPYALMNGFSTGGDIELEHIARSRLLATCPPGKAQETAHNVWEVLLYLVLPAVVGFSLGWRPERRPSLHSGTQR